LMPIVLFESYGTHCQVGQELCVETEEDGVTSYLPVTI